MQLIIFSLISHHLSISYTSILLSSLNTIHSYEIVNRQLASQILRARRKNSGFFEEFHQKADFERECVEERCSNEEVNEIYAGQKNQKIIAKRKWKLLTKRCYVEPCSPRGTEKCIQSWNKRECLCKPGFYNNANIEDDTCATDIDECARNLHNCDIDKNFVCINNIGSYSCQCQKGFELDEKNSDTCIDINECHALENIGGVGTVSFLPQKPIFSSWSK